MNIWTQDELPQLDPDYWTKEIDEKGYDEALQRAVDDRLTSMEFVIQGYTKDSGVVSGEIEFTERDLMFTTQNILRNDPNLRELVEKEILEHEPELIDKYVRGEM